MADNNHALLDAFVDALACDDRFLVTNERALLTNVLYHATGGWGAAKLDRLVADRLTYAIGRAVLDRVAGTLGRAIAQPQLQGVPPPVGPLYPPPLVPPPLVPPQPGVPPPIDPFGPPPVKPPEPSVPPPINPPPEPPAPPGPPFGPPPVSPPDPCHPPSIPPGPPPPPAPPGMVFAPPVAPIAAPVEQLLNPAATVDFMERDFLEALAAHVLEHERDFCISHVIVPGAVAGIDFEHQRARVFIDVGRFGAALAERVRSVFPKILKDLNQPSFEMLGLEAQLTACNDGEQFQVLSGAQEIERGRAIAFVYFFSRSNAFKGGELRLHETQFVNGRVTPTGRSRTFLPRRNEVFFFSPRLMYEILPVSVPSREFRDSLFLINGWVRR